MEKAKQPDREVQNPDAAVAFGTGDESMPDSQSEADVLAEQVKSSYAKIAKILQDPGLNQGDSETAIRAMFRSLLPSMREALNSRGQLSPAIDQVLIELHADLVRHLDEAAPPNDSPGLADLRDFELPVDLDQPELNAKAIQLMQELGLSQKDLATLTKKSRTYLNMLSNGKTNATPSFVEQLKLLRGDPQRSEVEQRVINDLMTVPADKRAQVAQELATYLQFLKSQ